MVDARVLIPRPETEQVVEVALAELERVTHEAGDKSPVVADLGTGSGAIALALAAEAGRVEVWATDASDAALAVARSNLAGLGGMAATRVRLTRGEWFAALPPDLRGRLSMVVSNPPYVAESEVADLPAEVADWEPRQALVAGPSGLEAVRVLLAEAPEWLSASGVAVIEIAPHQEDAARSLAGEAGFVEVRVDPDLSGQPRALVGRVA
jgi:release factor glutamine methyltransferase